MNDRIRVVVADDQNISRGFFEMYVRAAIRYELLAGLRTARDAVAYIDENETDLLILSLAGFYYENRSLGFSGVSQVAEVSMRRLLNSFVLELRHSEDSASDESGDSP